MKFNGASSETLRSQLVTRSLNAVEMWLLLLSCQDRVWHTTVFVLVRPMCISQRRPVLHQQSNLEGSSEVVVVSVLSNQAQFVKIDGGAISIIKPNQARDGDNSVLCASLEGWECLEDTKTDVAQVMAEAKTPLVLAMGSRSNTGRKGCTHSAVFDPAIGFYPTGSCLVSFDVMRFDLHGGIIPRVRTSSQETRQRCATSIITRVNIMPGMF